MKRLRAFHSKLNSRGFTLAELLIAVGILAVLFALGTLSVISIRRSSEQTRLDKIAETIFVAAQEQLTETYAFRGDEYDALNNLYSTDANKAIVASSNDVDIYRVTSSDEALASIILPRNILSEEISTDTYWVIEYSPKSCMVYSVFYSEKANIDEYYRNEASLAAESGALRGTPVDRINNVAGSVKNKVGYYQGAVAKLPDIKIDGMWSTVHNVYNMEKLSAEFWAFIPAVNSDGESIEENLKDMELHVQIKGSKSEAVIWLNLPFNKNTDCTIGSDNGKKVYKYDKLITLDDLEYPFAKYYGDTNNFKDIAENGSVRLYDADLMSAKGVTPKAFIPGENIEISCELKVNEDIVTGRRSFTDNSLFAYGSMSAHKDDENNITEDLDIYVEYGRHLQNLDNAFFENNAENFDNKKYYITQRARTIDFSDNAEGSVDGRYTGGWANDDMYGERTFIPITNDNIEGLTVSLPESADDEGYERAQGVSESEADFDLRVKKIKNLTIDMDPVDEKVSAKLTGKNAGLFDKFSGSEISYVYLSNINIDGSGISSSDAALGAIAGVVSAENDNVVISSVTLTENKSDDKTGDAQRTYLEGTGIKSVGGIIGQLFAAKDITLSDIYVDGAELSVSDTGLNAGGIVGDVSITSGALKLKECKVLSTKIIADKSNATGGLIGKAEGAGEDKLLIEQSSYYMLDDEYSKVSRKGSIAEISSVKWLTGGNNVGGLVGLSAGALSINKSFSASVLLADTVAGTSGGLVGGADGYTVNIESSYADNYIAGAHVGGLLGSCGDATVISNSYSAGFLINENAGEEFTDAAGFTPDTVGSLNNCYSVFSLEVFGFDTMSDDGVMSAYNEDPNKCLVTGVTGEVNKAIFVYHDMASLMDEEESRHAPRYFNNDIENVNSKRLAKTNGDDEEADLLKEPFVYASSLSNSTFELKEYNLVTGIPDILPYPYPIIADLDGQYNDYGYYTTYYTARFFYGDNEHYKSANDYYYDNEENKESDITSLTEYWTIGSGGDKSDTVTPKKGSYFEEDAAARYVQRVEEGEDFFLPRQNFEYGGRHNKTLYWAFDYKTLNTETDTYETKQYIYLPSDDDDFTAGNYYGTFFYAKVWADANGNGAKEDNEYIYWDITDKENWSDFSLTDASDFHPFTDVHQNLDCYAYYIKTGLEYVNLYYYIYSTKGQVVDYRYLGRRRVQTGTKDGASYRYITVDKHDNVGGYNYLGWYSEKDYPPNADKLLLQKETGATNEIELDVTKLQLVEATGTAYAIYEELVPYTVAVQFVRFDSTNESMRYWGANIVQPLYYSFTKDEAAALPNLNIDAPKIEGYSLYEFNEEDPNYVANYFNTVPEYVSANNVKINIADAAEEIAGSFKIKTTAPATYVVLYQSGNNREYKLYYRYRDTADDDDYSYSAGSSKDVLKRESSDDLGAYIVSQNDINDIKDGYRYLTAVKPMLEPDTSGTGASHEAYIICVRKDIPVYTELNGGSYVTGQKTNGSLISVGSIDSTSAKFGMKLSEGIAARDYILKKSDDSLKDGSSYPYLYKAGYEFAGWKYYDYAKYKSAAASSSDADKGYLGDGFNVESAMPSEAIVAVAQWIEKPVGIKIELYRQDRNDSVDNDTSNNVYILEYDTETTDTAKVAALNTAADNAVRSSDSNIFVNAAKTQLSDVTELMNYINNPLHFTLNTKISTEIGMDGYKTVRIYYDRDVIYIEYYSNGVANSSAVGNQYHVPVSGLYDSDIGDDWINPPNNKRWLIVRGINASGTNYIGNDGTPSYSVRNTTNFTGLTYLTRFSTSNEEDYYKKNYIRLFYNGNTETKNSYIFHVRENNVRTYGQTLDTAAHFTISEEFYDAVPIQNRSSYIIISEEGTSASEKEYRVNEKFNGYSMYSYYAGQPAYPVISAHPTSGYNTIAGIGNAYVTAQPSVYVFYERDAHDVVLRNVESCTATGWESKEKRFLIKEQIPSLPGKSDVAYSDSTYVFKGWMSDGELISDENGILLNQMHMDNVNIELVAKWEPPLTYLTYDLNYPAPDGVTSPTATENDIISGKTLSENGKTLKNPKEVSGTITERSGNYYYTCTYTYVDADGNTQTASNEYRFNGWYRSSDGGSTLTTEFTENEVITGEWKAPENVGEDGHYEQTVYADWVQTSGDVEYIIECVTVLDSDDGSTEPIIKYYKPGRIATMGSSAVVYAPLVPSEIKLNGDNAYYASQTLQTVTFTESSVKEFAEEDGTRATKAGGTEVALSGKYAVVTFNYVTTRTWDYTVKSYIELVSANAETGADAVRVLVDSYDVTSFHEKEQVVPTLLNGYNLSEIKVNGEAVEDATVASLDKPTGATKPIVEIIYTPDSRTVSLTATTISNGYSIPDISIPTSSDGDKLYIQNINSYLKSQVTGVGRTYSSLDEIAGDDVTNASEKIYIIVTDMDGNNSKTYEYSDDIEARLLADRPNGGRFRVSARAVVTYTDKGTGEEVNLTIWDSGSPIIITLPSRSG